MAEQQQGGGGTGRPQYYIFWMSYVEPEPDVGRPVEDIRKEHFAYLGDLEERGILLAAGPFMDSDGSRHGAGMMILRADSLEAADAIAAEEPFRKTGLRTHTATPWQWAEGSVSQTVRLKAKTFDMV